eukprot:TRINITY_DN2997_c0_g1_i1.p1 TRINITY_DN2997_c0_g1~~TRINITY_DN2997_c0_g1_i1.p1  ORF type:complete len:432 (-),score=50.98 TRINITY_DN2997_c0_g1_i1:131-1426(-)
MPELAEIHLMARIITQAAKSFSFVGLSKSAVSKCPKVLSRYPQFLLSSRARGKELQLNFHPIQAQPHRKKTRGQTTQCLVEDPLPSVEDQENVVVVDKEHPLLFRAGMTGHWHLSLEGEDLLPHSHLMFHRCDGATLSFVDPRRFGSWQQSEFAFDDRSPDPMTEYDLFVDHIQRQLTKVDDAASTSSPKKKKASPGTAQRRGPFDKPICELLLDQRHFNGIGNYLRAEILYRANINPFMPGHRALRILSTRSGPDGVHDSALHNSAVLQLCHRVPSEVFNLQCEYKKNYELFRKWIRCYGKMSSKKDTNGRMVWYAPSQLKSNHVTARDIDDRQSGVAANLSSSISKRRKRTRGATKTADETDLVSNATTDGQEDSATADMETQRVATGMKMEVRYDERVGRKRRNQESAGGGTLSSAMRLGRKRQREMK